MFYHPEALFLLQAIVLIGLPLLIWRIRLLRKFMPLVVVQVLLGLLLGPTILGSFAPGIYKELFPSESLVNINSLAWLGVSLLGFLTGMHFDLRPIAKRGMNFGITSAGSLLVPLLLGGLLALWVYDDPFISGSTPFWIHTLGIAIAVAVTALPVLSAILIELDIIDTPLGKRVLGYAVVNDIALWLGIAALSVFASTDSQPQNIISIIIRISAVLAFVAIMVSAVRLMLNKMAEQGRLTDKPGGPQLGFIICGVLISAFISEMLGIHFLFGAFVFGAIMPKTVNQGLFHAFEKITMVVLMPFYFMLTGLKTSFSLEDTATWTLFAVATFVAISSKIAGTAIPERIFNKSSISQALTTGVLMQTKGLMEIVVLNILLAAGVINTTVFSALVLMAVTTTLLTKPLILLVGKISKTNLVEPNLVERA